MLPGQCETVPLFQEGRISVSCKEGWIPAVPRGSDGWKPSLRLWLSAFAFAGGFRRGGGRGGFAEFHRVAKFLPHFREGCAQAREFIGMSGVVREVSNFLRVVFQIEEQRVAFA